MNRDKNKTREELIDELAKLRHQNAELKQLTNKYRRTEEKLKSSEERLRILFEYAPDGYYLNDLKGNFVDGNLTAERIIGYNRDELIGKNFLKLNILLPDQIPKAAKRLANNILGKPTGPDEFTLIRKDGSRVIVEVSTFPVKIRGKSLVLAIARDITKRKQIEKELRHHRNHLEELVEKRTADLKEVNKQLKRDIAERKKIEDALRESQLTLSTLMSNLPGFAYKCCNDRNRTMEFISDGCFNLTGYKPSDLIENRKVSYAKIIHPDDRQSVLKSVQTALCSKKPFQLVYRIITAKGDEKWIWEQGRGVFTPEGEIVVLEGLITDITERKHSEDELKAHREHLEIINKILRHDLINDITVIKSAIRLYRETKNEDFLTKADKGVRISIELINRMSELESFLSSHRDLKTYAISDTLREITKNYPSIDFEINGTCKALADEALDSVIDNILRNAIDHGKTKKIDVTVTEREKWCEIRIADYGVGIPDEIKDKIFEEGFGYGETKGSGLGLFIAKKTMERYGGSVYVEDNKPKGSVFVLRLMKML